MGLSINYARLGTAALWDEELPPVDPPLQPAPPQTVVPGEAGGGAIFRQRADPSLQRPGSPEPDEGDGRGEG